VGSATGVFLDPNRTPADPTDDVPDACIEFGKCQTGNLQTSISTLVNPVNTDPNPNPVGGASPGFAVEYVGPFFSRANTNEVSLQSGIRNPFTLPNDSGWELSFDWAFLSGQLDTGPLNNDYAVVKAVFSDGTPERELFRISRDDLQPGGTGPTTSRQDATCANGAAGQSGTLFLLCTGWKFARIDVSDLRGKTFEVQIILNKAQEPGTGSFFAFDNVKFSGISLPTVPVSLGALIPSPLFLFAGHEVTTYSQIKGGVTDPAPTSEWSWGDGANSAGDIAVFDGFRFARARHTFDLPGKYTVTATLTAADGAIATRTQPLFVLHRPGAIVLTYVCGNTFALRNYYPGEVTVFWNVFLTGNKGTLALPARPAGGEYSETSFTTGVRGTVLVFLNGILIQTKANGRSACPI
jgi:hypothetical protein